ncbi:O-acetyltransferase PaAT-1 [Pseudocercospora fuligena]|uniref:O-acetyltransferase PaAT-1 n=1 Tax=Pseudocercospora fuligena TaxID=685502 RepID=A0A8H6RPZ2_9PEZI|nr:O-acetyltransferase PaAT-1 [Pseudocercospora fuligena]
MSRMESLMDWLDGPRANRVEWESRDVFVAEKPAVTTTTVKKRRETAWLDGLRGIAAFLVVLHHVQPGVIYLGNCYNTKIKIGKEVLWLHTPAALPVIRLFFTGGSIAVEVFFFISGYVVPRRLVVLLHQGRQAEFIDALNSAVIRRPARLFIPAMATTFLTVVFFYITGIEPPWPPSLSPSNIFQACLYWMLDCFQLTNYFDAFTSDYSRILWTVVVEFKGSMALFMWLFAIHQFRAQSRVWLTLGLTLYLVFFTIRTEFAAFFAGLVTSEIDLLNASEQRVWIPVWTELCEFLSTRKLLRSIILHLAFIVALFFASTPILKSDMSSSKAIETCDTWPKFTWYLVPWQYWKSWPMGFQRDFWYFWSSWLFILTCKEIEWLKSLLEGRLPQYLGKNSFSLYLTHSIITTTLTKSILLLTGFAWLRGPKPQWPFAQIPVGAWNHGITSKNVGPDGFRPAELFNVFASLIPIFFLAEFGTRIFDEPSVWIAEWIWEKSKGLR